MGKLRWRNRLKCDGEIGCFYSSANKGYHVSAVGLNEATVAKYIREQESHDIALDKLGVKEYEGPFKRG